MTTAARTKVWKEVEANFDAFLHNMVKVSKMGGRQILFKHLFLSQRCSSPTMQQSCAVSSAKYSTKTTMCSLPGLQTNASWQPPVLSC